MKKYCILLLFITLFVCVACQTGYKKYDEFGGGYKETFYAPDRAMVYYFGNSSTKQEDVGDYALLRSAELAVENNYKYFIVVENKDLTKISTYTSPGGVETKETKTKKGDTTENKTEVRYIPPTTKTNVLPAVTLEVQFYKEKPELPNNTFTYDAVFLYNSLRKKYEITD